MRYKYREDGPDIMKEVPGNCQTDGTVSSDDLRSTDSHSMS